MNYYIGDMHLFCRSQTNEGINYDGRPFDTVEEMNSVILERWNTKVNNGDTVYILGDIALCGRSDALIALVSQLRGRKILIKGNHDDLSDYRYQKLFEEICDYKELTESFGGKSYKLCCMHYPILLWNGQHKGTILLYAHTHNSVEDVFFQECLTKINGSEELSIRRRGGTPVCAINVGAMKHYMDYEPRSLKEILERTEQGC